MPRWPTITLRERFDLHAVPEPNTGCWLWDSPVTRDGYGHVWDGKWLRAHRVSWTLHRGEIPTGLHVLHKCDVPSCVNPDHLFLGTHQDNMDDKTRKGRTGCQRGTQHWRAKFSEEQIRSIRADSRLYRIIAAEYGTRLGTVGKIKNRNLWAHVS